MPNYESNLAQVQTQEIKVPAMSTTADVSSSQTKIDTVVCTQIPKAPCRPPNKSNQLTYQRSEQHLTESMLESLFPNVSSDVRNAVAKYLIINVREGLSASDVRCHLQKFMSIYLREYQDNPQHLENVTKQYSTQFRIIGVGFSSENIAVTAKCQQCPTYFILDHNFERNSKDCLCSTTPFTRSWCSVVVRLYYAHENEWHMLVKSKDSENIYCVQEHAMRNWINCPSIEMGKKVANKCDEFNFQLERLKSYTEYRFVNCAIVRTNRWELYLLCPFQHSTGPITTQALSHKKESSCMACFYDYRKNTAGRVGNTFYTNSGYTTLRPTDLIPLDKTCTRTVSLTNGRTIVLGSKSEVAVILDMDNNGFFENSVWSIGREVVSINVPATNGWYTAYIVNVSRRILYDTKVHYTATKKIDRLILVATKMINLQYEFRLAFKMGKDLFVHFKCNVRDDHQETDILKCVYSDIQLDLLPVVKAAVSTLEDITAFEIGIKLQRILNGSGTVGKNVVCIIVPFMLEIKYQSRDGLQIYSNKLHSIVLGFSEKKNLRPLPTFE